MMEKYTYQDYLDDWEDRFEGHTSGKVTWYHRGRKRTKWIHRFSKEEWQEHLAKYQEADIAFKRAQKANDESGMGKALAATFPHELALLW
jgi:hypothetical protein